MSRKFGSRSESMCCLVQEQLGELLVKLKNDELQSNTAADTLSVHTEL